jgi:uncharacterized protein
MELKIVDNQRPEPWYAQGLRFSCTQCGNCCTGRRGFVWITDEEISQLAKLLGKSLEETIEQYCRRVGGRFSLKENFNPRHGGYDCVFLKEIPPEPDSGKVTHSKRVCSIYTARPAQCRAWPFWESNLASREIWEMTGERCPGIDRGRVYNKKEIETARDQIAGNSR